LVEPPRPNPDELLARVTEEERKQDRGRLKIFLGAAPGVGKTYAMLEAARLARKTGTDVLAGVVETHGRKETQSLLEGLEALPRRKIAHRGITLEEFDVDAALARKPALLLVDELAHTNAPGSRHVKRWQDVIELVDSGIDVYTTLNVQHLDSLNDVVAQITGVAVRETIPDSVLDEADEVELVDLPTDELRQRMEEGKVYIADQAQRAMGGFFRPGNLIALRELALRRTADRVDAQMRNYRRDNAIQSTWPVAERIMVSIGPSPYSAKLIRAAKRLAERLNAEWIVVFVETPRYGVAADEVRRRVLSSMRLAERLGAETVTLTGSNVAETLLSYAKSRNVTKIVAGKRQGPLWRRLLRSSVIDELIVESGDIEIVAISGGPEDVAKPAPARKPAAGDAKRFLFAVLVVGICTAMSLALRSTLNPANLVMIYLLGVVAVAMRSSRRAALFASVLSVAAFDFFCVPPYLTFAVSDSEYVPTFAVMLVVAVLISTLTVRIRMQAAHAAERAARMQALYRLTKELGGQTSQFEAARASTHIAREVFGSKVFFLFPDSEGHISFRRRTSDDLPVPQSEEGIAQWVFDHDRRAGKGMDTLPGATALYLPLAGSRQALGVMAIVPGDSDPLASPEQQSLLEIFANQTAAALERAQATAAAQEARLQAQSEQIRSGLLSAVSHDLRTPLATITGAATSLISHGDRIDDTTRGELLESIAEEADRLSRLVNNLLEITRLESGAVTVKREWHAIDELVGTALHRIERTMEGRSIRTKMPENSPFLAVDELLFQQMFVNILENAAKYSPSGTPIDIAAERVDDGIAIEVADSGPGFPPGEEDRIWDKFYRGSAARAPGAGLGLAIARAIVLAHGGTIAAANRPGGGATIRAWFPVSGNPPEVPVDA